MCGITGIWEYGANEGRVTEALVDAMRDTMPHRGPDDVGTYIFDGGRGGFGFRRLSIVDLSAAGHQPMTGCSHRDIWLVFNGEIYNHRDLRAGLEGRGHGYRSQTDSETILHLYEERGPDFVNEIEGDFAVAIWDGERREIHLYRDRLGVKPLYYTVSDGRLIFASEIKAILRHPAVQRDIDETSLSDYLTFLTTPAPRTLFRGINKLPAGCSLNIKRDGNVTTKRYWDALPSEISVDRTEQEHCEEVMRLLRSSIKKRMMSDVPFGVFLSGGVDSSANVALMAELMDRPVKTFTVGYRDHLYLNELESARRVSELFATDHHEVMIGEEELASFLPELLYYLDEPLADPVCVPLFFLSKLAHDSGTTVIQTGEGADEIFSGYSKYVSYYRIHQSLWRYAEKSPSGVKRLAGGSAGMFLDALGSKRMAVELARRFAANEPLFWGAGIVFDEKMKARVLSSGVKSRLNGHLTIGVVNELLNSFSEQRQGDFLDQMIYLELKLRLPELLLTRIDKITMANSIEARVPFLDHNLVEYAAGLPSELKISGNVGKYILKKALGAVLPNDLLFARKRGFGAPIREWFRTVLQVKFEENFLNSKLMGLDLFDVSVVRAMMEQHARGRFDWSFHLWALLNLGLWYDRWIEGND